MTKKQEKIKIDINKETKLTIQIIEKLLTDEVDERVTCYSGLERITGEPRKTIKLIIDKLKGLGFIELVSAWNEDGELVGSGYVFTTRATQWSIREWLVELKKINL